MRLIKFVLFIILINEIYALGIVKSPIKKIKNSNFKKLKLNRNKGLSAKKIYESLTPQERKLLKDHYDDFGGSYREGNKLFEGRNGLYEVNHVPPKSAYKVEYSKINPDDMPAHLMEYGDHRNYATTGRSSDNTIFRKYALDRE
jgi:hypothetical protein